jgi:hypothetical protein
MPDDIDREIEYYEKTLEDLEKAARNVRSKDRIGPDLAAKVRGALEAKKLERIRAFENARQAELVETPNLGPVAQDGIRYDFNRMAMEDSPAIVGEGVSYDFVPHIEPPKPGLLAHGVTVTRPGLDLKGPGVAEVLFRQGMGQAKEKETMAHEFRHVKEGLGLPPQRTETPATPSQAFENELAEKFDRLPPHLQEVWRMQQALKNREVPENPDHHAWQKAYQGYKRPY